MVLVYCPSLCRRVSDPFFPHQPGNEKEMGERKFTVDINTGSHVLLKLNPKAGGESNGIEGFAIGWLEMGASSVSCQIQDSLVTFCGH